MNAFRPFSVLAGALILAVTVAGCSSNPAKTSVNQVSTPQSTPVTTAKSTATTAAEAKVTTKPEPATATQAPVARVPATGSVSTQKVEPAPAPKPKVKVATAPSPAPKPKPAATAKAPEPVKTEIKPVAKPAASTTPAPAPIEPVSAAAESAPAEKIVVETIQVQLDQLPMRIKGEWILNRSETQCELSSVPLKMDDGQGGTKIVLSVTPGSLLITTGSDIDLSYSGTGITMEGKPPFALEDIDQRTNLRFSKQRASLLASMKTAQSMELTLGFWPTWPVTQTHSVNIPLQHFGTAMKAWETCNQLLSRK